MENIYLLLAHINSFHQSIWFTAGWKSQTDSFQVQISSAKSDISDDFNGNHMSRGSSSESVAATWPTTVFTQIRVLAARNFREARPRMLCT